MRHPSDRVGLVKVLKADAKNSQGDLDKDERERQAARDRQNSLLPGRQRGDSPDSPGVGVILTEPRGGRLRTTGMIDEIDHRPSPIRSLVSRTVKVCPVWQPLQYW